MSKTTMTTAEKLAIDQLVAPYITPTVFHLGTAPRKAARYDKRAQMYGGEGTVYLLQLFQAEELVNNRIGAYMILPTSADSCGFHTHGTRKEQELYIVMHGEGMYYEKENGKNEPKKYPLTKGNITSIKGMALHAVENTGDEPLIIFVVTTYEV